MQYAAIRAIDYCLPEQALFNRDLVGGSDWTSESIESKTGIVERRVAAAGEDVASLARRAATALFAGGCPRDEIDYLIFCTHSATQPCSVTACRLQDQLELGTNCGAVELALGCSGYVYSLGLAKGLIESGQASNVLLITADTYSRFLAAGDVGLRAIFGDGAAATWISTSREPGLGSFVYGTDGAGASHLEFAACGSGNGSACGEGALSMDGPAVFNFTLRAVPALLERLAAAGGWAAESIDLYVFHQANAYMLEHLRRRIGIAKEKFLVSMKHTGNTVSSSIPIALTHALRDGRLRSSDRLVLAGFGIGLSWAGCSLVWRDDAR